MADVTIMKPPQPAEDGGEPAHYAYDIYMKNGEKIRHDGYLIMTAALLAVCQQGYVHFGTPWDQVHYVEKLET